MYAYCIIYALAVRKAICSENDDLVIIPLVFVCLIPYVYLIIHVNALAVSKVIVEKNFVFRENRIHSIWVGFENFWIP